MNEKPMGPVIKVVCVAAQPDAAFIRFTREIHTWWPLRSHSLGQGQSETVVMEGRVGGRIVETIRGGREAVWGTITAWDPPREVAFTWHPGQKPETAGDVRVRFSPSAQGTEVRLEHSGFERLGRIGGRARRAYGPGWSYVIGLYTGRNDMFMRFMGGVTNVLLALRNRKAGASEDMAPLER